MSTPFSLVEASDTVVRRSIMSLLENIMGLDKLHKKLASIPQIDNSTLWQVAEQHLQLNFKFEGEENLKQLNLNGSLMIVTNHPRGLLDGISVGALVNRLFQRDDLFFIANKIIGEIFPQIAKYNIPVDNMKLKTKHSLLNARSIIEALRVLRDGKILALHPAGQVSEFKFISPEGSLQVTDCEWNTIFAELALRSGVPILPVHISGRNSLFYQALSFLGPTAKRIWNFREFMAAEGNEIQIRIRPPIMLHSNTEEQPDAQVLSDQVRRAVYHAH
jgi:putative hemolysin